MRLNVVRRHLVVLAALLVKTYPPTLAHRVIVLEAHRGGRTGAGEGEEEGADQRTVAQAHHTVGRDAGEQRLGLLARRHARLAHGRAVPRPAHSRGWAVRHHLADHQPVEQHADGGHLLLHREGGALAADLLHVGGHVHRLNGGQGQAVPLTP